MFPIKDTAPRRELPIITWMLILVNGLVFLFEISIPEDLLQRVFYLFGLVPARYSHPEWAVFIGLPINDYLPFLTNMFLHGGWIHIISNMWVLYLFGDNVEDRMGHWRFLIFYLLIGLSANIIHFIFNIHSTIPTIGASGAIAGIMGAYLVMFPTARVITLIPIFFLPYFVELPAFLYFGIWFISQIIPGAFSLIASEGGGGIAWWAHIGGFIVGIILLPVFRRGQNKYRKHLPDNIYYFLR